jgi:hypothetical protein
MNELKQIVQIHHRLRHIARGATAGAASRPEGAILPRQQGAPTSAPWLHEQLRWTAAKRSGSQWYGCDQNPGRERGERCRNAITTEQVIPLGPLCGSQGIPLEIHTGGGVSAGTCHPLQRMAARTPGAGRWHDKHILTVWSEATKTLHCQTQPFPVE